MIHVVVPEDGLFGINNYRASRWRDPDSPEIIAVSFRELFASRTLKPGTWIFTCPERLPESGRRLAASAFQALHESGQRVLNDPATLPTRYQLLQLLNEAGINDFRSYPATTVSADISFPVFVRQADLHNGSMSPLLHDRKQLNAFLRWQRLRGVDLQTLLVVEFCDVSGGTGTYLKYSAFCVADQVIGRYRHVDHNWMVKAHAKVFEDEWAELEHQYVLENPHQEQVRQIFDLAGIEFGRIDYGLLNDKIQVWEINTNPTFGPGPGPHSENPERERLRTLQAPTKRHFYREFAQLLKTIDTPETGSEIAYETPVDELAAYEKALKQDQNKQRRIERRALLFANPLAQAPKALTRRLLGLGDDAAG